jgi:lysine 2,3-aminomutase
MVVPSSFEDSAKEYEMADPIGDKPKTVIAGLIHRYPDRVLVNLTSACAVHCRFCFRKNLLCENENVVKPDVGKILSYMRDHKEIWEVIFSGGDPFMLKAEFLKEIIGKISKISHIKTIRFHSRIPVVDARLITGKLLAALKTSKKLVIVVHINHPREISKEFQKVVQKFQKIGALIMSQTVLLKGVNDDTEILSELFRELVVTGVKPYYLHHLDAAKGTHHFRISIEKGKKIFQSLRGNLSSICLPEYVVDIPGGFGKIPVNSLKKIGPKTYTAKNFENKTIKYVDHI